jgi:hypothetical protein
MNNINIKNIFCANSKSTYNDNSSTSSNVTSSSSNEIGNVNVHNLVKSNSIHKLISDDTIVNKIKLLTIAEKKKTDDIYNLKYSECLLKINNAIDVGLTDIFFSVPINIFGYKIYNPYECLKYIEKKSRSKNFETLICKNNTIFISWKSQSFHNS